MEQHWLKRLQGVVMDKEAWAGMRGQALGRSFADHQLHSCSAVTAPSSMPARHATPSPSGHLADLSPQSPSSFTAVHVDQACCVRLVCMPHLLQRICVRAAAPGQPVRGMHPFCLNISDLQPKLHVTLSMSSLPNGWCAAFVSMLLIAPACSLLSPSSHQGLQGRAPVCHPGRQRPARAHC